MNKKKFNEILDKNVKNQLAKRDIIKYENDLRDAAMIGFVIFGVALFILAGQLTAAQEKLVDAKQTSLSLANKICDSKNAGTAFQVYTYNNGMIIECSKGSIRYTK